MRLAPRKRSLIAVFAVIALVSLRGWAEKPPGSAEFEEGMRLYRARDCAAAVRPLEVAARASPQPSALLALGFCYRQLKTFDKATDAYQRYLQIRPDDEKRARSLLQQTKEEDREWRRTHPEVLPPVPAAPLGAGAASSAAGLEPPAVPPEKTAKPSQERATPTTAATGSPPTPAPEAAVATAPGPAESKS